MPGRAAAVTCAARRADDPAVPFQPLLAEIREPGYPGSMNLLCRYITRGREPAGPTCHPSPSSGLLTRPPGSATTTARCPAS